ncbi:MAG TPA: hypothetical protein VMV24_02345 [Candidatus Dormibacteraeota bacterium]|nr:hypothetical protein [Candidatus Dormibacteraeota bacterium]
MSNLVIALLLGIGSGGWVYNKLLRTTGNNKKNALIGAIIIGLLLAILLYLILGSLFKKG